MNINFGFYTYKVNYWNEAYDAEEVECGITVGNTYVDAMQHIMDYYGKDLIEVLSIYEMESGSVLPATESICQALNEGVF